MGTKKENYNRVNKGWKILSICVGCMLLIALSMSQVAFAKEEEETAQAQEAQTAQMQEEVQETSQTQESLFLSILPTETISLFFSPA